MAPGLKGLKSECFRGWKRAIDDELTSGAMPWKRLWRPQVTIQSKSGNGAPRLKDFKIFLSEVRMCR